MKTHDTKQKGIRERLHVLGKHFKRDWQLHLIIWVPLIYVLIMEYGPMYGVQIVFRDYNPFVGIAGSEWVGLQWFKKFLTAPNFWRLFSNTVILSVYSLVVQFPLPIIFALIMNALRNDKYGKVVATVTYLPHFISTTVMVGILMMVLSPVSGLYGNIFRLLGGNGYPYDFRASKEAFRHLHVWSGVWQGFGWSSILYTSALSAVSQELHEAARVDGASRFKRMIHVDLPAIMPTIAIMLIMRVGHLVSVGFEKVYMLQTDLNRSVSEVLATYVYSFGLSNPDNFSYASAITLFNTVINITLMAIVNRITKKISEGEVSLW